jgi:hypothetical protein
MTYHLSRETLMPRRCIAENGFAAHRICSDCWFGEKGFVNENIDHACPGCIIKFPLTYIYGSEPDDEVIVIE